VGCGDIVLLALLANERTQVHDLVGHRVLGHARGLGVLGARSGGLPGKDVHAVVGLLKECGLPQTAVLAASEDDGGLTLVGGIMTGLSTRELELQDALLNNGAGGGETEGIGKGGIGGLGLAGTVANTGRNAVDVSTHVQEILVVTIHDSPVSPAEAQGGQVIAEMVGGVNNHAVLRFAGWGRGCRAGRAGSRGFPFEAVIALYPPGGGRDSGKKKKKGEKRI